MSSLQASTWYQDSTAFRRAVDLLTDFRASENADQQILHVAESGLDTFARSGDVETACVAMLPGILAATDTPFGVLAEVVYDRRGVPHLQSHATTNIYKPGYTRHDILTNLQFYNLDTLNGAVMLEKKPVFTNDPENDPRSGGVPIGHAPMTAYLGLPFLVQDDTLVGALLLGNKPGGYTDADIRRLAPYCEIMSWMIEAVR